LSAPAFNSAGKPAGDQPAPSSARRPRRWLWSVLIAYAALLLASHLTRAFLPLESRPSNPGHAIEVRAIDGEQRRQTSIRLAYREYLPADGASRLPVVLLHGSPGHSRDFFALAPALAGQRRLIVPDLPGFGQSTRDIPDYSLRAHARYTLELMDKLNLARVHLVGFSMGGGVALNLAELAPERVASLTMLSAIGVQEMELLGDYHLNRAVHGLQLACLWLLREGTPHFGSLDDVMLSVAYARNFYDSDQRPLRAILQRYAGPMLILHGRRDPLVPVAAAVEHHRLVAQSELQLLDDNHFMVFTDGRKLAPPIADFLQRVEAGQAPTRLSADPARLEQAAQPFDPASVPQASGIAAFVLLLLIAAATLVSEDLTCIGVGVMVAQGRIGFLFGSFACFLGIFVGDILLFLAGRYLGRPALRRAPLKWLISAAAVERSSAWFARKGAGVIVVSRFLPGTRLPTYFAAGALNTSFWWFTFYFFLACAVWTPLLVGLSALLGGEVIKRAFIGEEYFFLQALAAIIIVYLVAKLLVRLATQRGRRMLVSAWRRKAQWEFWPPWMFYPPVIAYIAYLALKHRSLSLFTAANPAMPAGGFIGESKAEILRGLAGADGFVARAALIAASTDVAERLRQARQFMAEQQLSFPVVLKPDAGQRGSGVVVARSEREMEDYFRRSSADTIIQEHVAGDEFGVFYYRRPGEEKGRIFAITEKRFPVLVGDGRRTLERLIWDDARAVCMARFYCDQQGDRLWDVPGAGERVQLVELGTHCRGAIFLDGGWVKTEALEAAVDRISRCYDGFYFGRYDIRAASLNDFQRGENFKVIELNGVTSEATNIYDPRNSLLTAYRILFAQWRLAFEIGARNRARGAQPTPLRELVKMMIAYREQRRARAQ
jgi:pimeloyl-ACP methyl ester carboxylesterase/membrane protein DedA with SNARE-associated domain